MTKYNSSGKVTRAGVGLRLSGQGSGVGEKFWIMGTRAVWTLRS